MNDDKIKPLTGANGNVDGEIANVRDTFLNAEYDYLLFLLKDERNRNLLEYLNGNMSSEGLFKLAQERIDKIENGEVKEEDLEQVEGQITLLLAAIQDKVLIKRLILTIEEKERERFSINFGGRTR